ncbi:MAG: phospholipase, partial [Planctomycetota bacterium]|nr:phospholipase [Planctomycetota bacterium]
HGYGERGRDGEHLPVGLGPVLDEFPERFPGIVVLPQCPADRVWVSIDRPWAHGLPGAEEHVDAAVAVARRTFWIDPARITLTGLSMGGFGTFVHGSRRTDVFRAFAPVCGGGQPGDAERIVAEGKPLFVVHGALDDVVEVEESRRMVAEAEAVGASVVYREYADLDHVCWDRAYREAELARFLFEVTA